MYSDTNIAQPDSKKIELLAPAGGFEALKAAVENGADAVYLGGKMFNARASASNFEAEELQKALTYAQDRQVKIYVTVNTLVADSEFSQLAEYLYELSSLGVDAVIVQDIGVARFIKEVIPEMRLHASTQMTINNSFGLKQLEQMGFSRVVLARETTSSEIEKIVRETNLEVEVFGHGALCICYSGQCLMSSYIGARSGNRGRCAQPCRMPYQLTDFKGEDLLAGRKMGEHLLSPRDLNLSENLAELQKVGISSLKIEGRMKRPEYVATVIRIYRQALDALNNRQPELSASDKFELTQIFNRDFTTGFFQGNQGAGMMSFSRPNNRGTMLGRILEMRSDRLTIKLENTLNIGDGLEIWTGRGREGITVDNIFNSLGKAIESAHRGENVGIEFRGTARIGDRIFKTHDQELMAKAKLSYQEGKEKRKRPVKMLLSGRIGSKLRLEASTGEHRVVAESQTDAQEAVNRPLEHGYLSKQLGRLGNTPFVLKELITDIPGNLIIPVSEINDLRRSVVEQLLLRSRAKSSLGFVNEKEFQMRLKQWHYKIESGRSSNCAKNIRPKLTTAVSDSKNVLPLIKAGADRIIIGGEHWRCRPPITLNELQESVDVCFGKGVELLWRLPRVMNEEQSRRIFSELNTIVHWRQRPAVMVGNLAGIQMIQSLDRSWSWETDHFFHVFNQAALHMVLESGGKRTALSTELSQEQIKILSWPAVTEMIVFGDMEMMISEFCLLGSALGEGLENPREKCGHVCQEKEYYLKDRLSYKFPLATDRECRMHIFNAKRLNLVTDLTKIAAAGLRNIRLELPGATLNQAQDTVKIFKELWLEAVAGKNIGGERTEDAMKKLEVLYPEGFTKGHFYRGVLT